MNPLTSVGVVRHKENVRNDKIVIFLVSVLISRCACATKIKNAAGNFFHIPFLIPSEI